MSFFSATNQERPYEQLPHNWIEPRRGPGGGGEWECSFSLKIRLLPIPASAIANNAVTIRYLIGRDEKTRGREKRKDSTRNFNGEYVETRGLGNEHFLSSDEYCVKERNERKEETEKYHGVFYRIVGFTGKRFLFSPPPPLPPHSSFFALSLSNFRSNNSIGNALLAFVLYSRRLLGSLFGPLYVSGKLPTYPFPKPKSTLTSH